MAADEPLMVLDDKGVVVRWSRQAEQLLGRAATEVVGRPATSLVTDAGTWSGPGAEPDLGAVLLHHRDGRAVTADLQVRPVLRPDGSVVWAISQAPEAEAATGGTGAAVLEALFTESPVGLYVLDTELRIVRANKATRTTSGVPAEQTVGRSLTDVYGLSSPSAIEAIFRRVLESGMPAREHTQLSRAKGKSGGEYGASFSAFPLQGPHGTVLAVAVTEVVATEREKTHSRTRILDAVRERVGRTLDVVDTCQELVETLVPGFADIAVVEIVESAVRGEDPPLGPLGRDVPLLRAAFRISGGAHQAQAHPVGDVRSLPSSTPYGQALADLQVRVLALDADTPWLTADPARAEAIRASGAHSLIAAPLTLRGTVLGLVSLYRTQQADPYDEHDVALARHLAAHTALCVDNARRYTREHTIAATIQRHLLPPCPSSQTTVETAHLYVPGNAGAGGWFDTFALPGARVALVVGDVAGQGVYTATTMGQLRTAIHSLAALDLDPDELLARLNDTAKLLAAERTALPPADPMRQQALTASCVYAVYDPLTCTCTFARAGHPPPVIAHPCGTTEIPDLPTGPLLGSIEGPPFAAATVKIADGSVLALYTPAILPTSPSGATGDPGPLRQVLLHPDRPLQDLCDDALYRLGNEPRPGDAILLVARTHAFPPDRVATWELDHNPTAAATARAHASRQLAAWDVEEESVYATELIVSELVTNAVRYAAAPLRLRIIKDRTLTCEVHDSSFTAPRMRHARTVDEGGRGLFIVAQLAQNWGTRYTPDGKTVWTEQALPPQPR
ncbi:SpoIIE family protein phosphatase [Streptomyces mirabilis]|uniref:SpoIIE family protein phosphatase n=1 Tax=Streptomyces mirabilis TaxID=68239 RepID=UPI002B1CDCE6|nr:SpoIIE family protein phosphatase [Streptomyces mirabilis]